MEIGPRSREQLTRLKASWKQGEHLLVTGPTGSGKTVLARQLDQIRLDRGGSVVVFVCKMQPDETITRLYSDFKRWKTWHKSPLVTEQKVLFWPDVEKKTPREAVEIFKREIGRALDEIGKTGKWTVHIDEGLFVSNPAYLGLGNVLGLMYALMRSSKGTMVTLAQRPSHLPLAIYSNLSHAFVGRASELPDLKRLADMDSTVSSRDLQRMIQQNSKHDFVWIQLGNDEPPERMNLKL